MSQLTHNARIIYWSTLLGSISFLEPVVTLFYLHRGLSPYQIFMIWPVMALTNLLGEVPTGTIADRFGARFAFFAGGALQLGGTCLLLAPASWAVFIGMALKALGWTFFSGAEEALVYESLKEINETEQMSAVMGRIGSAGFLPMIGAFLVGPYMARNLTAAEFVLLIALSVAALGLRLLILSRVENPRSFAPERHNPFMHIREAFGIIRTSPILFRIFLNGTLVFIPVGVFMMWDQPYLTDAGLHVEHLGLLYAAGAASSWFLTRHVGWCLARAPRPRLLWSTALLTVCAMVVASLLIHSLMAAVVIFFLLRMTQAIRSPILSQLQNDAIPSGSRATTLSMLSLLDSALDLIVISSMAAVAGRGLSVIFGACALVALAGLLVRIREPEVIVGNSLPSTGV